MTEWQPGEGGATSGFGDTTEEFIHVIAGQLAVRLGEEVYLLGPGDAICFEGVILRGMELRGDQLVPFSSVITPPAF